MPAAAQCHKNGLWQNLVCHCLCLAGVKALIETVGMDVLALAPHTVDECKRVLQLGGVEASVQLFVPVFPITSGAPGCNGSLCWNPGNATQKSFVLQGLFQPHRQPLFNILAKSL